MNKYIPRFDIIVLLVVVSCSADTVSAAGMKLGDVTRVRGQETNTIHGYGIVVGLSGTGDKGSESTKQALAQMLSKLGGGVRRDRTGKIDLSDIETSNAAGVIVSVTIPAVGSQQGDLLDVTVSAISAKSLEGGQLMMTPLVGPRVDDDTIYGLAQGTLQLTTDENPTVATIENGAKMETTIRSSFEHNGKITLVIDKAFADWENAQTIEGEINTVLAIATGTSLDSAINSGFNNQLDDQMISEDQEELAHAVDQVHIEVTIPQTYQKNPARFVDILQDTPIQLHANSNRVVINESDGIIAIGKDVEVAPVLITHNGLQIDTGVVAEFNITEGERVETNAKLKTLTDALKALNVSPKELIKIIKTLKAKGDLYGEVIYQ